MPDEQSPDLPPPKKSVDLLYEGIQSLIRQLQNEGDLGVYEAVGALEAVKADLLDELDHYERRMRKEQDRED